MVGQGESITWACLDRGKLDLNPVGCDKDLDLRIKTWAGTPGVCREDKSRKVRNDCQN